MAGQSEIVRRFGSAAPAPTTRRKEKASFLKYTIAGNAGVIALALCLFSLRASDNSMLGWLLGVPNYANAEGRMILFESAS